MTIESSANPETPQNLSVIASLKERKQLDERLTFALPHEVDANGRAIEGQAAWIKLHGEGGEAEGKLFAPIGNDTHSLIIFEPGMPGDAVGWMEGKHVPALLKEGYTVLVLRHLGTKVDTEKADTYIKCPERQERTHALSTNALGDKPEYDLEALSHEPTVALNTLGPHFRDIKMVGHSAGALFNAAALAEANPEVRQKISSYVSLSGFVGGIDERAPAFSDIRGYFAYCTQHLNMGSPIQNESALRKIFERVYTHKEIIPSHTMATQVHAPNDEYLTFKGAEKFHEFLNRGLLISDATQTQPEFHDLKNLQPETLVRLLALHYPKAKHSAVFSRQ